MARRVLFVIRGKLGDTLVAYATVREYLDRFPDDEVSLLVRSNYAALLAGEKGLRVVGFSSRLAMLAKLVWMRVAEPAFDALLVLWGFGRPIRRIGRLVRASRKIYLDGRWPDVFPEHAEVPAEPLQSEPMWRVAQVFAPSLPRPERLSIPSLAARYRRGTAVGIVPVADEARRVMGPRALGALARRAAESHPGSEIRVLLNAEDRFARAIVDAGAPPGARLRYFDGLDELVREVGDLAHLYATDTGLAHLAAAMGVPHTVFYGPTQPWRNSFSRQPALRRVRLAALGREHCEVKDCTSPECLERAVSIWSGAPVAPALGGVPPQCPLRGRPAEGLCSVRADEGPDPQA